MRTLLLASLAALAGCQAPKPEKLTIAFLPQRDVTALLPAAQGVAERLSARVGAPVEAFVATDYAAVVEALRAGHAQAAFLSGWPAALGARLSDARVVLGEVRGGKTSYWSHFYARKGSGIGSLRDARGKRVAFTSPTSSSGYLFPLAKLVEEGLLPPGGEAQSFFKVVTFAGGYEQALRALARGDVDVAAASEYAFELYLTPEERARIVSVSRQGPVPTHGFAVKESLAPELREKLVSAVLELSQGEDKELLKKLYGAESFARVGHDEHLGPVFSAEERTNMRYGLKK